MGTKELLNLKVRIGETLLTLNDKKGSKRQEYIMRNIMDVVEYYTAMDMVNRMIRPNNRANKCVRKIVMQSNNLL